MSTILAVPGVPACSRIKVFSYKLRTEDRLTDFDLRGFYSGFNGKETYCPLSNVNKIYF